MRIQNSCIINPISLVNHGHVIKLHLRPNNDQYDKLDHYFKTQYELFSITLPEYIKYLYREPSDTKMKYSSLHEAFQTFENNVRRNLDPEYGKLHVSQFKSVYYTINTVINAANYISNKKRKQDIGRVVKTTKIPTTLWSSHDQWIIWKANPKLYKLSFPGNIDTNKVPIAGVGVIPCYKMTFQYLYPEFEKFKGCELTNFMIRRVLREGVWSYTYYLVLYPKDQIYYSRNDKKKQEENLFQPTPLGRLTMEYMRIKSRKDGRGRPKDRKDVQL